MVNPTHLVCMYLIKFVELVTTMLRGVHLNKSRLDRKSDGHTFGIIVSVRPGGEVYYAALCEVMLIICS